MSTLHYLGGILGLIKCDPNTFLQLSFESSGLTEEQIAQCILDRKQARLDKKFSKADEIRMYLKEQGIELEDTAAGTSWRRIV